MAASYDPALGLLPEMLPPWFQNFLQTGQIPTGPGPEAAEATPVLPTNNKIALFGDNRASACLGAGGLKNVGFLHWALYAARQRCRIDMTDLNAQSTGWSTSGMMKMNIDAVLNTEASTVIVMPAYQDRNNQTAAWTIANLVSVRDRLRAKGKVIIFIAERPRGCSLYPLQRLTGDKLDQHLQVRQWILSQASTPGIYVADPWEFVCDSSQGEADIFGNMTTDGILTNATGAAYEAQALTKVLEKLFLENTPMAVTNLDSWNATHNPLGCVNLNPMLIGTGGTPGVGGSGELPDSYVGVTGPTGNGITRTYSKVIDQDGFNRLQCVIAGSAGGASPYVDILTQTGLQSRVTAGGKLEAFAELDWGMGVSDIQSFQLGISITDPVNGTKVVWDGERSGASLTLGNFPGAGIMRVGGVVVPANATDVSLRLVAYCKSGGSPGATVRIRGMALRHMPA